MIKPILFSSLEAAFGGRVVNGDYSINNVVTDSRKPCQSAVFIALVGDNFDGHEYLTDAIESGAEALVISERQVDLLEEIAVPVWVVPDTLKALGDIARVQRENFHGKVIAVTGSSGKTTVKGMLSSILSTAFGEDSIAVTRGNLNNYIGVPLTVFSLKSHHKVAVIELGASAVGEIDYLSSIVQPDVALVNNVFPAHLEGFGSLENIAKGKGEIYNHLHSDGIAIINGDDEFSSQWMQQCQEKKYLQFSISGSEEVPDCVAKDIVVGNNGRPKFQLCIAGQKAVVNLSVIGEHNVANALAAASCAFATHISLDSIVSGLEKFHTVQGRSDLVHGIKSSLVIDDSYNANPGSVLAGIRMLSSFDQKKFFVLGDMGELGDNKEDFHTQVGDFAKNQGVDYLFAVGELSKYAAESFGDNAKLYSSQCELIEELKKMINEDSIVLIKGSRSASMENVVSAIKEGQ